MLVIPIPLTRTQQRTSIRVSIGDQLISRQPSASSLLKNHCFGVCVERRSLNMSFKLKRAELRWHTEIYKLINESFRCWRYFSNLRKFSSKRTRSISAKWNMKMSGIIATTTTMMKLLRTDHWKSNNVWTLTPTEGPPMWQPQEQH